MYMFIETCDRRHVGPASLRICQWTRRCATRIPSDSGV